MGYAGCQGSNAGRHGVGKVKDDADQSRYGLGQAFMKMTKLKYAEHHFRRAVEINPSNPVLLCCVGQVRIFHRLPPIAHIARPLCAAATHRSLSSPLPLIPSLFAPNPEVSNR